NKLLQHQWPGNVRELKNAADRFVLGISEASIDSIKAEEDGVGRYEERMEQFEKQLLTDGLRATQGQLNDAAELLDLSRKTLYRKMKKYHLDKQNFRRGEENGQG
ncbi:helix-turn-helix domain-containing protein, partial [Marinomonas sp.]